jgi:hypothetical protein
MRGVRDEAEKKLDAVPIVLSRRLDDGLAIRLVDGDGYGSVAPSVLRQEGVRGIPIKDLDRYRAGAR